MNARWLLALALLPAAAGCRSVEPDRRPRLPFHVALAPIETAAVARAGDEVSLFVDGELLTEVLAEALEERCFSAVTVLPRASFPGAGWGGASRSDRDDWSVRTAAEAGADLLLECQLVFQPEVEGERNDRFWLNLPLFLLGGPACYFVDDRSYRADARLVGHVFDLNPIHDRKASLEDGRSRLAAVEARFEGTTMDFVERSGGLLRYLCSLVVPSGLLPDRAAVASRTLGEDATSALVAGIVDGVLDAGQAIVSGSNVASAYLEPHSRVLRRGGELCFEGQVIERLGDPSRLEEIRIRVEGDTLRHPLGPGIPDPSLTTLRDRFARHRVEMTWSTPARSPTARVELVEGGRDFSLRTFTLRIEDDREE